MSAGLKQVHLWVRAWQLTYVERLPLSSAPRIFVLPPLLSLSFYAPAGGFKDADHQNDAEVQSAAEFAAKEVLHPVNLLPGPHSHATPPPPPPPRRPRHSPFTGVAGQ